MDKMSDRKRIVTEQEVHDAVGFLRDEAANAGRAKARLVRAGHMIKHIEALETVAGEGSMALRQAQARASKRYLDAIEEEAKAAGAYEEMRSLREAAAMLVETWRSEQANYRAIRV